MKCGIWVPNFGDYADPGVLVSLARDAEAAGWDGLFLWDHVHRREVVPTLDPWVGLAAVAAATRHMRIGTLVTPLPRRRPTKLAREVTTLDHLSRGRVVLGVGLGSPPESEFAALGEDPDAKLRAQKLDEGLAVLEGLWSGEAFSFAGEHYRIEHAVFLPRPFQEPRPPIWVAGVWPARPGFRRAARFDGVFPIQRGGGRLAPGTVREIVAFVEQHRTGSGPFDVLVSGETTPDDPAAGGDTLSAYRKAGATWWLEWIGWRRGSLAEMRARVRAGPLELPTTRK